MFKNLKEILKRKAEIRSILQSDNECDIDALEKELRELEDAQKAIEKRQELAKQIGAGQIIVDEINNPIDNQKEERSFGRDSEEYRSAFFKYLAGVELSGVEKRAMTTNTTSAGVAVPTITMNKILEKIGNDSVVYNLVNVSHLAGNVSIPLEKSTANVERKGEGEEGTILDDTLGDLKLGAKKYIKLVRLTCELEATSIDALEDYIVRKLSKKLSQAFDYDIINGTGTKGAKGILATIDGEETAEVGKIDYDDICDLFAGIPAKARKNATLLMSTNTLYKKVKKIKDENKNPIFDPAQNKVLGRDVTECDDVPDGTMIFGDLSEYQFNWSKEAELSKSKESAFASGDTVYRILSLNDGGVTDLGAIAVMKEKTA